MRFIRGVAALLFAGTIAAQAQKTFANPLDLEYRFMPDGVSRREAADPLITLYGDTYYLFASKSGGYWYSPDMRVWQLVIPDGYPVEDYAPAVVVIDGRMYYTAHKQKAIYTTDDPKTGHWRKVADIGQYSDPAFFLDDDEKLYLTFGSSLNGGISIVQLDYHDNFKVMAGPVELMKADYAHHGWERSGPDNLGAQMTEGFRIGPFVEGSWMTKHNGVYYLQYAAPGTVWKTYADGVYTSTAPMSGFTYAPYSPFSYKPGGFVGSAGHSGMFQDKADQWWRVTTLDISVLHKFERRIGLFPAGFDADGVIRTDTYLGDYPQFIPGLVTSPLDHNRAPWMLLSAGKKVFASSTLEGHPPELAVDEDIRTQWSATSDKFGEWFRVDLGDVMTLRAIQINFGEQDTEAHDRASTGAQHYEMFISNDATKWTPIADFRGPTRDAPHVYFEMPEPLNENGATKARHVMITNVQSAGGGKFAIRDLRVFGTSPQRAPDQVRDFTVQRDRLDDRSVTVTWKKVHRASGYIVRFGLSPEKLYQNYQVGDADSLTINALNSGVKYYFTVDALGEGGVTKGTAVKQ